MLFREVEVGTVQQLNERGRVIQMTQIRIRDAELMAEATV
jgi:hypothetical protein